MFVKSWRASEEDKAMASGTEELRALNFTEAWAYVLRTPEARAWAFERRLPSASELLQAYSHGPLLRTIFMDGSRQHTGGFTGKFYAMRHEEIFCCVRSLPDGTRLGYVLNAHRQDVCAPVFGQHDARYIDAAHHVQKLIVAAPAPTQRLFVLECNWLLSGALLVRFQPCCRLGHILRLAMAVRVFTPRDASQLAMTGGDFRAASLSDVRYRLDCIDTAFQSSCIFCTARGATVCGCPMPMRRRSATPMKMVGYVAKELSCLWYELCAVMTEGAFTGAALHNITRRHTESVMVLDSNITPFKINIQKVTSHPALQSYFSLTASSATPVRRHLTASSPVTSELTSNSSHGIKPFLQVPHVTRAVAGDEATGSNYLDRASHVPESVESISIGRPRYRVKKSSKQYICPFCGVTIRYKKSNLQRHIANVHERSRRFTCNEVECHKMFQTRSNLRRHLRVVHKISQDGATLSGKEVALLSDDKISAVEGQAGTKAQRELRNG